jgi:DNA-binding NtrC family response regulator
MPLQRESARVQLVYVVDDEAIIASTLTAIIKTQGIDARHFTHPGAALEAARLAPPDVLLSDVFMPEMTGVELAIQVSEMHPECKVLLLSGQAATNDLLQKARESGHHFKLLSKPLHPDTLLHTLKHLLKSATGNE